VRGNRYAWVGGQHRCRARVGCHDRRRTGTGSIGNGTGSVLAYYGRSHPIHGVFKLDFGGGDSVNIVLHYYSQCKWRSAAYIQRQTRRRKWAYTKADAPLTFTTLSQRPLWFGRPEH
jgi:hypothetical protein